MYSSYSFTSALDGGEWSESRYPLYRRLGGPQSRSGHRGYRKKSFASARDRTSIARSSSSYQHDGFSTAAGEGDGAVVTCVKYSLKHYFHQSGIRSAIETSASVILVSLEQFFSTCGPRRPAGGF
jgi:hypothetical protein